MPPASKTRGWLALAAFSLFLAAPFFLGGCSMTPEDREFYGRGWINPDELDREEPPPHAFQDQNGTDDAHPVAPTPDTQ